MTDPFQDWKFKARMQPFEGAAELIVEGTSTTGESRFAVMSFDINSYYILKQSYRERCRYIHMLKQRIIE